ncbi:hypothetical protein KHQ81_08440 [Mycoplasmatota bacterium]|nr:hypothetical protein KHQ81_08440 [Mycoplasmatota bacterium]
MDYSKINQSQLKYSCTAGGAAVNLYTGRLLFEHPDITMGSNGYEIGVSHIYNSQIELPSNINTCMGNGWKLDIQQYIFKDENDNYVYLDGAGYQHVFEKLQGDQYYDTTGLGLILTVNSSNKVITDEQGNQMKFKADRLVSTTSCQNSDIVKSFNYTNGKLKSIYDGRKKGAQIVFDYDITNGLLKTIKCKTNLIVKKIYNYYYDSSNKLVKITMTAEGITQNIALFSYTNGKMDYTISMEDQSALKFNYTGNKINKVSTGVAKLSLTYSNEPPALYCGDDLFCGDDIFCGENDYRISGGVETIDEDKISHNEFEYNPKNTIVTNDKEIKMVYYFNDKGFTTSILEANNGDVNDLRSLEKIPGKSMISQGNDVESINTRKAYVWSTSTVLSAEINQKLKDYREKKCLDYVHYTCSFWLKLNQQMRSSKINITVSSSEPFKTETEKLSFGTFDNSAVNSWQFISIPVYIPYKDLKSIKLEFEDKYASKTVKIADMRLSYSSVSKLCLTNSQSLLSLDMVTSIEYNNENPSITEDFYISENDIQSTYLSFFEERVKKSQSNNNFVLSCCDKTKKIVVNSVVLSAGSDKKFPIEFEKDNFGSYKPRAQFYRKLTSPDNNLKTYMKLDFIKNIEIGSKTVNCIRQITEANKGSVSSYTESYVDLTGKILMVQDEYEVQTLYDYDTNGILSSKTIQNKNDLREKLTFNVSTNASDKSESDYKSNTKTYYNDPFGNIDKIEYNGKGEDASNKLTTTFGYNLFKDKFKTIENDIDTGGKNYIHHDSNGRLLEVTPIGWNSNDMYGFKFGYNVLGKPCKYYLTYKNGNQKVEDLLVEKIINHTDGTITTKQYRDKNNPDISTVTLDKYGRTKFADEGGNITTFKRQDSTGTNGASVGATEVTKMYDPYENRTYIYHYDDSNNVTGYDIKNSDGTPFFSIKASGENKTEYNGLYKSNNTLIINQEEKLLNPRIKETNDTGKTFYSYDNLGRIEGKIHHCYGMDSVAIFTEDTKYKPNTLLKKNIITKLYKSTPWDPTHHPEYVFDYTYDYRGNIETSSFTKKDRSTTISTEIISYTYDKANRLKTEKKVDNDANTKTYTYNKDGSINTESVGTTVKTYEQKYMYKKGRLVGLHCTDFRYNDYHYEFDYDNLGNCTKYMSTNLKSVNMEWERGNLLKKYIGSKIATYSYNNQGIRFKKEISGNTTTYYLDGAKLLGERLSNGKEIRYMYNAEGIMGFQILIDEIKWRSYFYVKDALDNVLAIFDDNGNEVVVYEYDSWGNCSIKKDDKIFDIGTLNPIRWKSQYYDNESGLYYINGRYYSPIMKQYVSALSPETAMVNAGTVYGLNMYLLTVANPVNMNYNGYTIATNTKLTWDPPSLSGWQIFWKVYWGNLFHSSTGKAIAIVLFVVALIMAIFIPVFRSIFIGTILSGGLVIGTCAAIAGFQSDKGFLNGFVSYINEEWAQHVAIDMTLALMTFGVSKFAQLMAKGVKKATGAFNPAYKGRGNGLGVLDGKSISVSEKGLNIVEAHLSKFDDFAPNNAMLRRLNDAFASGRKISGADASFYIHELSEATYMARGIGYSDAHRMALQKYGVSRFSVYHADVINMYPGYFNSNWSNFWR